MSEHRRQFRWWREGGFRWPWLARKTGGKVGLGRLTQAEVDRINARAAQMAAEIAPLVTEGQA